MTLIGFFFSFIFGLAVIIGGLAGSLLVYGVLEWPMLDEKRELIQVTLLLEAILLGVNFFIFLWFCASIGRRRSSRGSASKLSAGDMVDEHMEELAGFLDKNEDELSEAKLKERGDRIGCLALSLRTFAYFMLGSFVISSAFVILMIPFGMLAVTWELWEDWGFHSPRVMIAASPRVMIAVIFSCLTLAFLAVRYVPGFFSPDKSKTKKTRA